METYEIHITGQVQGVGFRPYVFRMARTLGINGETFNAMDGVHILFNSTGTVVEEFYQALIINAPVLSRITASTIRQATNQSFTEFKIVTSEYEGQRQVLLTPDFAMCGDCRKELNGGGGASRREGYPFITCTNCGPRYSIIHRLPYDRNNTSMDRLTMCQLCGNEYDEPTNRRFFSQTNSCPECGINLQATVKENELPEKDYYAIIQKTIQLLDRGKIIAVKGIGGYLLICDAANKETIGRLRSRKHRPSKPFALMYSNIEMIRGDVRIRPEEERALADPSAPILLLQLREDIASNICVDEITPGLSQVGIMLPYAPLFELILSAYNKPIIATSANVSNSPIVYEDGEATAKQLSKMADCIIGNNRQIVVPQDDSVIKYSAFESQKIVIRRSRGLAPTYINPDLKLPMENVLATGALLKSTFTLTHQQNVYISQYLGDLDNYDAQKNYQHCLNHFFSLLDTKPEIILIDSHPDYFSTRYGVDLSKELKVPVKKYQHHVAHFAAVLGENNLLTENKPVLGVIWDGVGLGDDGNVWGGEFFIYENHDFQRCGHFSYFDYILGDKMAREPRLSALAATTGMDGAEGLLKNKFSEVEWHNYQKLLQKKGNIKTSSTGRLFDAVASLLDLSDISTYEGEAAMYLENLALSYFIKKGLAMSKTYFDGESSLKVSSRNLLERMTSDIKWRKDKGFIAAKFHCSLAVLVKNLATKLDIQDIALSGGVFQNGLLVDLIRSQMTQDQHLFLHRQLSPNDECISFGQLCCYIIEEQKLNDSTKNKEYVPGHPR